MDSVTSVIRNVVQPAVAKNVADTSTTKQPNSQMHRVQLIMYVN